MRSLSGQSVLITGGGSGLGAGAAAHFARGGARVTISGRRSATLEAVAEQIGPEVAVVVGDVTIAEDRERMVATAVEHGNGRLDTLLANAGNMLRGPIESLDEQELLDLFHSNVVAAMMLTGSCVPYLQASRGAVVFVGSVHTQRAFPGACAYAATKGALEALTGVLAAELGPRGIRVGCVRPGAVLTEINVRAGLSTPEQAAERLASLADAHVLGRIGTAEEIAEAFEYLACAEWTTGAILTVDGGLGLGVTNA